MGRRGRQPASQLSLRKRAFFILPTPRLPRSGTRSPGLGEPFGWTWPRRRGWRNGDSIHDLNSFRLHDIPSPPLPSRFSRCLFNRDVVDVSYGYILSLSCYTRCTAKCLSSVETCQIFGWKIYLNYVIKFRNLIVIQNFVRSIKLYVCFYFK